MAVYCRRAEPERQDLDGVLRWAYDYWRLEEPLDLRDGQFTAGDFAMVYRRGMSGDAERSVVSAQQLLDRIAAQVSDTLRPMPGGE